MKAGEQRALVERALDWSRRFVQTRDFKSMGIRPAEAEQVFEGCIEAMKTLQFVQDNDVELRAWAQEKNRKSA